MSNSLIKRLSELNEEELRRVYHNIFDTDAGQLILEDIKGRFWEYVPPHGQTVDETTFRVGQQSVLFHIKNMLNPIQEEETNVQSP